MVRERERKKSNIVSCDQIQERERTTFQTTSYGTGYANFTCILLSEAVVAKHCDVLAIGKREQN